MKKLLLLSLFLASPSVAKAMAGRPRVAINQEEMHQWALYQRTLRNGCRWGDIALIANALKNGADINSTGDFRGDTPLHIAALYGHPEVVEFLITKKANINAKNDEGSTPLRLAVSSGSTSIVALLIAYGADTYLTNNEERTVYDEAVLLGHTEIVELILAKQREWRLAKIDPADTTSKTSQNSTQNT